MKVEIQLKENQEETNIVIYAKEINQEVKEIMERLSAKKKEVLKVQKNEETYLLEEDDIETIYTEEGKVYIRTKDDIFQTKMRLYEFELELSSSKFIRISNSEIINFDKVKNLNTKLLGTICINLKSGYQTYVSRRYIKKIKDFLEL